MRSNFGLTQTSSKCTLGVVSAYGSCDMRRALSSVLGLHATANGEHFRDPRFASIIRDWPWLPELA